MERSIESARRGARVQHFIGAATIALNGEKAIAETRMVLMVRGKLDGVEVDATCWGRFHDRFVKQNDQWRIHKRVPVYEKDRLDTVDPAATLSLDAASLATFPEGCRHLVYLQSRGGASITPHLPVPGSEALTRLEADSAAWLAGESAGGSC